MTYGSIGITTANVAPATHSGITSGITTPIAPKAPDNQFAVNDVHIPRPAPTTAEPPNKLHPAVLSVSPRPLTANRGLIACKFAAVVSVENATSFPCFLPLITLELRKPAIAPEILLSASLLSEVIILLASSVLDPCPPLPVVLASVRFCASIPFAYLDAVVDLAMS